MAKTNSSNIYTLASAEKSNDQCPKVEELSELETTSQQMKNEESSGGAVNEQAPVVTIVQQIKQRLPTLVLNLKDALVGEIKDKSLDEQEQYVLQNIDLFRRMILENIEEFKELVLSARPSPSTADKPNYEERKVAYQELLRLATALMVKIRAAINKVCEEYKIFINKVWKTIHAGNDAIPILNEFNRNIELYLKESWAVLFTDAEKMEQDISELKKSNQEL